MLPTSTMRRRVKRDNATYMLHYANFKFLVPSTRFQALQPKFEPFLLLLVQPFSSQPRRKRRCELFTQPLDCERGFRLDFVANFAVYLE